MRYRVRPVFVSGTFRDFHAERDAIASHVFPALVEKLGPYRTHLERVDLRVGVETKNLEDDHAKQALVLKVCLTDVRRCRPFLVILMGDRYGWVPPVDRARAAVTEEGWQTPFDGKSVTALEIEFGLWGDPEQRTRSRVYFRKLDYTGMVDEKRVVFDDAFAATSSLVGSDEKRAEAKDRAFRLAALKQRITDDPVMKDRWREYGAAWDGKRVVGLDSLTQMLVADLLPEMQAEAEAELTAAATGKVATPLEEFVADRARGFTGEGRKQVVGELVGFATGAEAAPARGLVLAGPAGSGKSALFARTFEELAGRADVWLLGHAAGIDPRSTSVDALLEDFVAELAAKLVVPDPLAEARAARAKALEQRAAPGAEGAKPEEVFADLLARAAVRHRVVVLLDALDRFERTSRAAHTTWLPTVLPANVRLVATAIPGVETEALGRRSDVHIQPVAPLGEDEARAVAEGIYARYHHAPNLAALALLLEKQRPDGGAAHDNPLWLVGATEELNQFDADDFSHVEQDFAGTDEDKLYAFVQRAAGELSPEIPGLYEQIFRRAGRAYGAELLRASVATIAAGRAGFRERDLATLVPTVAAILDSKAPALEWDALAFAALRRGLRAHLVKRGADDQWDFHHAQAREAGLRGYLGDGELRRQVHAAIAAHLLQQAPDDPLRESEAMWHLIQADNKEHAARLYAGDLPPEERDGATIALVQHARTDEGLRWITALLSLDDLDEDLTYRLAGNCIFRLDSTLDRSALHAQRFRTATCALRLLEALSTKQPDNKRYALAVLIAVVSVGDAELHRGHVEQADQIYDSGLKRLKEFATRWGMAPAALVRVLFNRKGAIQHDKGDRRGALAYFKAQSQTALSGEDPEGDRHAVTSLLAVAGADQDQSADQYVQAVSVARRLHDRNPDNDDSLEMLIVALAGRGDVALKAGRLDEAAQSHEESLEAARRLTHQRPDVVKYRVLLGKILEKVGDSARERGQNDRAGAAYAEGLDVLEAIRAAHPDVPKNSHAVMTLLARVGDLEHGRGNDAVAVTAWVPALKLARDLAVRNPDRVMWWEDLCRLLTRLGDCRMRQGERGAASELFHECLEVQRRLEVPTDPETSGGVMATLQRLARLQFGENNDQALRTSEECVDRARRLLSHRPEAADRRRNLALALMLEATCQAAAGNRNKARANFREAHDILQPMHDDASRRALEELKEKIVIGAFSAAEHDLAAWKALPLWRRAFATRPNPTNVLTTTMMLRQVGHLSVPELVDKSLS